MSYGVPLTEEQRAARHYALTGETVPPPRGTGRAQTARLSGEAKSLFWIAILFDIGAIAVTLYAAWKEGWLSGGT